MNTGLTGDNIYDFSSEENSAKWKGLLTAALKKVSDTFLSFYILWCRYIADQFENSRKCQKSGITENHLLDLLYCFFAILYYLEVVITF